MGNREWGMVGSRWLAAIGLAVVVSGCMSIGGPKEPVTIYAPQVRVTPDPAWPMADWQLSIGLPTASRMRSEAHTSELQPLMRLSYGVFSLKKNNKEYVRAGIMNA